MASMVLLNIICWLLRETTNSLIYEGGTQNEGNIMSIAADHLADYYTNAKVQRLPLTHQISPSGLFRGRALKYQLLMKVFDLISISMFCGLSQSHFRLRGSERISEWGRIWASISIGTYQGNLFCREHVRGQYSSMRLRKSDLSMRLSMWLSWSITKTAQQLGILGDWY